MQEFSKNECTRSGNAQSVPYVFGIPLYNLKSPAFNHLTGQWTEEDKMISYAMMTYWTNFIKKGYGRMFLAS